MNEIKTIIRKFVLASILADNYITNLAKKPFRSKWGLEGSCKKCGRCCLDISLEINPALLKSRFTIDVVVRWVSWIFNFYFKRIEYDKHFLVFGCKNLNEDGTCGDYKWRPNICRNYPIVDYFDEPALFDTCGFNAKQR